MGREPQKAGREAEILVEAAFEWYVLHGLVGWWSHPGPRMLFFGPGRGRAKAVGVAPPDFVFFYGKEAPAGLAGRGGLLEVKRTLESDELTLRETKTHREITQYRHMKDAANRLPSPYLVGPLVLWRGIWEWRFYPVVELDLSTVAPPTVVLRRERGVVVPSLDQAGLHIPSFLYLV